MKKYRIENVVESYSKVCNKDLLVYGNQILYEMEQDFIAMRWALSRMKDFIDSNEKLEIKPPNYRLIKIGYEELLNRVSEYSCPTSLKDHLKTKERCLLKENCRCVKT